MAARRRLTNSTGSCSHQPLATHLNPRRVFIALLLIVACLEFAGRCVSAHSRLESRSHRTLVGSQNDSWHQAYRRLTQSLPYSRSVDREQLSHSWPKNAADNDNENSDWNPLDLLRYELSRSPKSIQQNLDAVSDNSASDPTYRFVGSNRQPLDYSDRQLDRDQAVDFSSLGSFYPPATLPDALPEKLASQLKPATLQQKPITHYSPGFLSWLRANRFNGGDIDDETSYALAGSSSDDKPDDRFKLTNLRAIDDTPQKPFVAIAEQDDELDRIASPRPSKGQTKDIYLFGQRVPGEKSSDDKRDAQAAARNGGHEHSGDAKFTTLLEDEPETDSRSAAASTAAPPENQRDTHHNGRLTTPTPAARDSQVSTSGDGQQTETSTYSYGTVVTRDSGDDQRESQKWVSGDAAQHHSPPTSMFSRMYSNIVKYLPFLDQLNFLRNPTKPVAGGVSDQSSQTYHQRNLSSSSFLSRAHNVDASEETQASASGKDDNQVTAKPRVSIHLSDTQAGNLAGDERASSEREEDNKKVIKDKQLEKKGDKSSGRTKGEDNGDLIVGQASSPAAAAAVSEPAAKLSSDTKRSELNADETFVVEEEPQHKPKVNLIRQSNLVLPFKSDDELVLRTTTNHEHPDSLLGKYIYAPTHHYYLSTGGADESRGLYSKMAVAEPQQGTIAHLTRLHPGDAVLGSYEPVKSMYPRHKGDDAYNSMMLNKTNDIYFIVMVGAFCAMAMAVVLAAGLFAYRVQQNRKSTSDTDYPTYGVVGPNNLNGKCGAAAFVGGYFGNPNSNNFGIKTGSAKNLPDSASGDSGVANLDKSGSKRSSTSDQQLQQQQQPQLPTAPGNRSNYMNNQNAARMYHYQHQKQQMIISDRASTGRHTSASDLDSEDENDDGSYTVYECSGLASAHEMEIKNPLFNDDRTP